MPPKAETGSPRKASSNAIARSSRSASPQGMVCLTMATAGSASPCTAFQAASASSRLLNDSSLPASCSASSTPRTRLARAQSPVGGGSLLRVLPVAQRPRQPPREGDLLRPRLPDRAGTPPRPRRRPRCGRTPSRPGLVCVGRRTGRPSRSSSQRGGVVGRVGQDDDSGKILGRGADHGRAADVDLLQRVGERDAAASDRGGEGIEIGGDDVDRDDLVRCERAHVRGVVAAGQQPAVDARVERLDPAVEDLREAGDVADRRHRHARCRERRQRAAGGDDLVAERRELRPQRRDPGLVVDAQQRPHAPLAPADSPPRPRGRS